MKKLTSLLVVFAIALSMFMAIPVFADNTAFDGTPATAFAGGNGTAESPYEIATAAQLAFASNEINAGRAQTKYFKLTADIDYNNQEWNPIGISTLYFKGSFDGDRHKISNLTMTGVNDMDTFGLFGYVSNATIINVGIENMNVTFSHNLGVYAGGLAAYVDANTLIENCYVKNSVIKNTINYGGSKSLQMGAFIGCIKNRPSQTSYEQAPIVRNCYAYNVEMQTAINRILSGFIGRAYEAYSARIENCYAANIKFPSSYKKASNASGILSCLFGFMNTGGNTISITNCYSDLTGGIGSYTDTWTYHKPEYELATTGATKDAIIAAFEPLDAFGKLSTINDGYPCLIIEDDSLMPTPEPTFAPLDITNIPGATKFFEQNFDSETIAEGDRVTTSMGFPIVNDTGTGKNAQYYVAGDEITDVPETSNRVMRVVPKIVQARASEEQYAALVASEKSVKWGNDTYKVIDFIDGYYIASKCTTRNTSLYWFKKSSVVDGVLASTVSGTDYDTTFYTDDNGTLTGVSKGITGIYLVFPTPSGDAGKYAIQFDYAYPDNGNMHTGQEGFNLQIDGGEYHIRPTGLFRGYNYAKRELDFGANGTSTESAATNKWIPKADAGADIPHYFLATDDHASQLTEFPTRVDMTWYKVMVYVDTDNKFYTIYLDGYPLYFKAANGGYSCRMKFSKDTLDPIFLYTNRLCIFNDHAPVFDNFAGYYSTGSDEETVARILKNIELPYVDVPVLSSDIVFDKNESGLVTWSFSNNSYIIDSEQPLIARYNAPFGEDTSKVTLTATCTYGTATGTRDFELTVKNRTKYEVDTVTIKDSSGNRVYRPVDGSVIESVSYTANSSETAEMYLAVYENNGRLKNAIKATAQNGKCTFNQLINADETYKVFIWENGTVIPLTVPEMGEYPESATPTIYVIGDSIAQTYTSTTTDIKGFGQYLDTAFNGVTVDNTQAVGGRTTKYALAEDRLKYVLDNAESGDYLFIMLGHNDEKLNDYYGATLDEYKAIFEQMINGAKDKGVTPVILTSLARPQWNQDGTVKDSHDGYRQALYEVAEKSGTALIDIDTMSRNVLKDYNYSTCGSLDYFVPGDTHTTEKGAKWVVGMIADELLKMNLPISEFLK